MRILVLSDSHGQANAVFRAVEAQPTARVIIHLGDGAREAAEITDRYPDRTVYSVQGNCDAVYGSTLRPYQEETLGGKRFFFTHGHLFGVKTDRYRLECAARERQADIVLFGHTHVALTDYADGLYSLNPGSLAYGGTYGLVDITPAGVVLNVVENRR